MPRRKNILGLEPRNIYEERYLKNRDKYIENMRQRRLLKKGTLIEPSCFKITYYSEGVSPFSERD